MEHPKKLRGSIGILALMILWSVAPAQDVTSDTTAIRAILRANGISDTVSINYQMPPPPSFSIENGRVSSITMDSLGLTDLTIAIGSLDALGGLRVNNNNLTNLPQEIGSLVLSVFEADNNQLTTLPSGIGDFDMAGWLHVRNNQLTSLPDEIGNIGQDSGSVTNLLTVNLSNNQLVSLPNTIGNIYNLGTLYLNDNELTSLPSSIGNLQALGALLVNNNQLTSLPDEIVNAPISILQADNNLLTALPDSMHLMDPELSSVQLANNKITELPATFVELDLTHLDLENNELERFPPGITGMNFSSPVASLNIHGNRLCTLITQPVADWLDSQTGTGGWRQTQRCNVGAVGYAQGPNSLFTVFQSSGRLDIRFKNGVRAQRVTVVDLAGKNLVDTQIIPNGVINVKTETWSRGVYIIRAKTSKGIHLTKAVVD